MKLSTIILCSDLPSLFFWISPTTYSVIQQANYSCRLNNAVVSFLFHVRGVAGSNVKGKFYYNLIWTKTLYSVTIGRWAPPSKSSMFYSSSIFHTQSLPADPVVLFSTSWLTLPINIIHLQLTAYSSTIDTIDLNKSELKNCHLVPWWHHDKIHIWM